MAGTKELWPLVKDRSDASGVRGREVQGEAASGTDGDGQCGLALGGVVKSGGGVGVEKWERRALVGHRAWWG